MLHIKYIWIHCGGSEEDILRINS